MYGSNAGVMTTSVTFQQPEVRGHIQRLEVFSPPPPPPRVLQCAQSVDTHVGSIGDFGITRMCQWLCVCECPPCYSLTTGSGCTAHVAQCKQRWFPNPCGPAQDKWLWMMDGLETREPNIRLLFMSHGTRTSNTWVKKNPDFTQLHMVHSHEWLRVAPFTVKEPLHPNLRGRWWLHFKTNTNIHIEMSLFKLGLTPPQFIPSLRWAHSYFNLNPTCTRV